MQWHIKGRRCRMSCIKYCLVYFSDRYFWSIALISLTFDLLTHPAMGAFLRVQFTNLPLGLHCPDTGIVITTSLSIDYSISSSFVPRPVLFSFFQSLSYKCTRSLFSFLQLLHPTIDLPPVQSVGPLSLVLRSFVESSLTFVHSFKQRWLLAIFLLKNKN